MSATVSKIGAIICAVIAAIALFMPVVAPSGDSTSEKLYLSSDDNAFKSSYLDEDTRQSVDSIDAALKTGFLDSKWEKFANNVKQVVLASTIAIFGVIAAAVCVLIGKLTANRKLAMIMSIVGVCAAGFLVISVLMMAGSAKDIAGESVFSLGAGPVVMTIGTIGALVFTAAAKE